LLELNHDLNKSNDLNESTLAGSFLQLHLRHYSVQIRISCQRDCNYTEIVIKDDF